MRFVHDLYEFNDKAPAPEFIRNRDFVNPDMRQGREKIVDLHGWCLMGNHYHLLLSERVEGGLSLFLRKLNVGYANYFNERYKRAGTLFQGRTKKIHIDSDAYFLHILHYIHLNPLDMSPTTREWRLRRIQNAKKAISHLDRYKWSSYTDYCGKNNFPSLLTKELFAETYPDYKKELSAYLADIEHLPPELTLEG